MDSYLSGLLGTKSSTTVLRPSLLGSMTLGGPSGLLPSCPGPCFGSCSVLMCLLFQCLWGSLMFETSTFNASILRADQQDCQNGLIWRPCPDYHRWCQDVRPKGPFRLYGPALGGVPPKIKPKSHLTVQDPPTQGHDRDMGTTPNPNLSHAD